ncbi:hypothetical protein MYX64_07970 [Nitrospinae bacterium AH_259_B05_G02_I21]|nr:hypothetical protein [Nitrospinae bacterium AH_259_B05_G02_I21]
MRYLLTKHLWVPFTVAAVVLLALGTPALAQTTPRDKADAMWANLASHVADRQAAYLATNGRYFQGIRTHSPTPADGAVGAPDPSRKPTDQVEDWTGAGFTLPASMPAALAVHVYDGPAGKGYTAIFEVVVAGKRWRRAESFGPEAAWRTHAWVEIRGGP